MRPHTLTRALRQLGCWLVLPLAVGSLLYAVLWQRYEQSQAAARTLPAALARQFAMLPPPVATPVTMLFIDGRDALPRIGLQTRVWSGRGDRLRIRVHAVGSDGVAVTYVAANGRAGCAALTLSPPSHLRVAYGASRRAACVTAQRGLERR